MRTIFTDGQTRLRKPTNLKALTSSIDQLDWFSAREEGLGKLYAKRTMERALAATRKRHAHRLTNAMGTDVQNGQQNRVQNAFGREHRETK